MKKEVPSTTSFIARPVALLRRKKVEEITGLSRSSIYAHMAEGTFPRNVLIGPKSVRWVSSEIQEWCADKMKNHRKKTHLTMAVSDYRIAKNKG